jgi:Glycosyl transferase family 11
MTRAIEVLIGSGLGNQMFQYALGRSLSVRLDRPLILDTSLLFQEPGWGFDLRHLRLGRHRVRKWPFLPWRIRRKLLRVLASQGMEVVRWISEPGLQFSPEVLATDKPCVLKGYWQSERYFDSISGQLREDFVIVTAQDPRSAECQTRIRNVKSIGLHVRRADYVTLPSCNAFHGTCSKEYYDAALQLILSRLGQDMELFVFSDDMEWARENIQYALPTTYVDWNQGRGYEDMRLMSSCRALIMANSSFSWWAGWLNARPDKLVVAPRQWYRAPGAVSDLPLSPWLVAI